MAFNYEIKKRFGSFNETKTHAKEVNLISYNGAAPIIDIRIWNKAEDRMGKGITIRPEDVDTLLSLLVDVKAYLETMAEDENE
jgi:hypothetical protein